MLSPRYDDDVHCVFVCDPSNHYNPKLCIAAFTNVKDAAAFVSVLGVRYCIEPYRRDSVIVRNVKIVESLYYGN